MTSHKIESVYVQCPYCWERFEALIDCSIESQEYIEDCEVCCRPITFDVYIDERETPNVTVKGDNE